MKQHQKILLHMLGGAPTKIWRATDFQQPALEFGHPHFVGYEASARMSDIARLYPELVDKAKDGKYRTLAIRWEKLHEVLPMYPEVADLLKRHGMQVITRNTFAEHTEEKKYKIYVANGVTCCSCPGYFYRKTCKHVDEYTAANPQPLF